MFIAAANRVSLMALALVASGAGKLMRNPQQMKTMQTDPVPEDKLWLLATAEIAGAAGLVVGLFWWPIGIAAAVGVILSLCRRGRRPACQDKNLVHRRSCS